MQCLLINFVIWQFQWVYRVPYLFSPGTIKSLHLSETLVKICSSMHCSFKVEPCVKFLQIQRRRTDMLNIPSFHLLYLHVAKSNIAMSRIGRCQLLFLLTKLNCLCRRRKVTMESEWMHQDFDAYTGNRFVVKRQTCHLIVTGQVVICDYCSWVAENYAYSIMFVNPSVLLTPHILLSCSHL